MGHSAIYVRWLMGWCYISSLDSAEESHKDETAVHCCNSALSLLVMFGVSKRLSRSISLTVYILWLTRSLVDPMLAAFIVYGPLKFLVSHWESAPHNHTQLFWDYPHPS